MIFRKKTELQTKNVNDFIVWKLTTFYSLDLQVLWFSTDSIIGNFLGKIK